jgi:Uncharacterised nucleotidyltransferase
VQGISLQALSPSRELTWLAHRCAPDGCHGGLAGDPANDTTPDGDRLIALAFEQGVAPLLVRRLLDDERPSLEDDALHALEAWWQRQLELAHRTRLSLAGLLASLGELGVAVIPLKGPLLAERLFGDAALRRCRDLDLLVREADAERVVDHLLGLGYRHPPGLDDRLVAHLGRYAGQYILFPPGDGLPVEPHWALTPRTLAFDLDYHALWAEAGPAEIDGIPHLRLAPHHLLIALALHGTKEQWPHLKSILDVAALAADPRDLDWARLRRQAEAWGCARAVRLGLTLAARILGLVLNGEMAAWVSRDRGLEPAVAPILARLGEPIVEPDPYRLDPFYWRSRERPRDRLRYLTRTLLTPRVPHLQTVPLPRWLAPAYPLVKLGIDYVHPLFRGTPSKNPEYLKRRQGT